MATKVTQGLTIVKTLTGNTPYADELPVADDQDWKNGEPVYLASGYLTKRSAATQKLLGLADGDAENSATAEIDGDTESYIALTTDMILEGSVESSGAATGADAIQQTDLGTAYGIKESGVVGDKWVIDKTETSDTSVRIIKLIDKVGDFYGRVQCVPLALELQIGS